VSARSAFSCCFFHSLSLEEVSTSLHAPTPTPPSCVPSHLQRSCPLLSLVAAATELGATGVQITSAWPKSRRRGSGRKRSAERSTGDDGGVCVELTPTPCPSAHPPSPVIGVTSTCPITCHVLSSLLHRPLHLLQPRTRAEQTNQKHSVIVANWNPLHRHRATHLPHLLPLPATPQPPPLLLPTTRLDAA
jgi:hypothetical protein